MVRFKSVTGDIMPKLGRDYPHNMAVRLDTKTYEDLKALKSKLEISASAVIRLSISKLAEEEKEKS